MVPPQIFRGVTMLTILLGWCLLLCISTLCSAGLGRALGIKVEEVSLGSGPRLLRRGKFSLSLIPCTSFLRFKHTQTNRALDPSASDLLGAIDQQRLWVKAFVAVSGPLSLLALALPLLGSARCASSFFSAFGADFRRRRFSAR